MADRNDERSAPRSNDPVTAPDAGRPADAPEATRPVNAPEAEHPRQSELNASRMSGDEAASRKQATESGRSAAKWFGIGLVVLVLIIVLGGVFGGGAWVWGPAEPEAVAD